MNVATGNGNLAGSLAKVLKCLQARRYERLRDELWRTLLDASAGFSAALETHLVEEESVLFPAICEADPAHAPQIESLRREHADLRSRAADLAGRIQDGDSALALETGKELFSMLVSHAGREQAAIDAILASLPAAATKRLARLLPEEHRRAR
jgi:hemerythrin-like domain-containing protein